jgi:hypothetical protein
MSVIFKTHSTMPVISIKYSTVGVINPNFNLASPLYLDLIIRMIPHYVLALYRILKSRSLAGMELKPHWIRHSGRGRRGSMVSAFTAFHITDVMKASMINKLKLCKGKLRKCAVIFLSVGWCQPTEVCVDACASPLSNNSAGFQIFRRCCAPMASISAGRSSRYCICRIHPFVFHWSASNCGEAGLC